MIMITPEKLDEYAGEIETAIASASLEINNNGQLFVPQNAKNLRTATFHLKNASELSSDIRLQSSLKPDEPISVSLRHFYNPRGNNRFVFWASPLREEVEQDDNGHNRGLCAVGSLLTGRDPEFYIGGSAGTLYIDELAFKDLSKELLGERIEAIASYIGKMSLRDALTLATLELREQPLEEKLTKEVGEKYFSNSAAINGFRVEASTFQCETSTELPYSLAKIALEQSFNKKTSGGIGDGILLKNIEIRQEAGKPTTVKKSSKISLMNNPFIYGDGKLGFYAKTYANEEAPESLRHLIFPDDIVTEDDLNYFMELATEPLDFDNLDIKV